MIALLWLIAADWTLLQNAAANTATIDCKFSQDKRSPLFRTSLHSEGTIRVAPAEFHLQVLKPDPMTFDVSGTTASIESSGKREPLPIEKLPKVQAFFAAFSELFLGKTEALEKVFVLETAQSDSTGTTATLSPKEPGFLQRIVIHFGHGAPQRIVFAEDGGDETTMTLSACRR